MSGNLFPINKEYTTEQAILKMLMLDSDYNSFIEVQNKISELDNYPPWDYPVRLEAGHMRALFEIGRDLQADLESDIHDFAEASQDEDYDVFPFDLDWNYLLDEKHVTKEFDGDKVISKTYDYSNLKISSNSLNEWSDVRETDKINNTNQLFPSHSTEKSHIKFKRELEAKQQTIIEQKARVSQLEEQLMNKESIDANSIDSDNSYLKLLHKNTSDQFKIAIEANDKFWVLYDNQDESTAPIKKQIESWFMEL